MEKLTLDRAALDDMFAHARGELPDECCGAVVTQNGNDRVLRFTNIQNRLHADNPAENPRTAAMGYAPEPKELFAAIRAGEEPGARLAVFYHSHAINGSYFSDEDRTRAMFGDEPSYPDVSYVVLSDARLEGEVRAFRWDETTQDFIEQPLEVRGPARKAAPAKKQAAVKKPAPKTKVAAKKKAAPAKKPAAKKPAAKKPAAKKKLVLKKKPAAKRTAVARKKHK
ncbi:MAG TPA: Mov34/MPN/PAD-1 family protein [Candidatus Binatia bacterium]|nr:Mov34/MPN/PAD-1 family protein [Candidatus Binatia bacterium]